MDLFYRVQMHHWTDPQTLLIHWWRADSQTWRSNCPDLRRATMLEF